MDALALLCNLHADGPATLQRLRRIGCESIDGVVGLMDDDLGRELRQSEAGARRFKREAHNLLVRLVGGTPLPAPEETEEETELEQVPEPKLPGMGHVLEAWRQMDEQSPPSAPSVFQTPKPEAEPETPRAIEDKLDSTCMDGLTPEVLARLGELGIRSVHGLVEAASLELSQDLPMPLTRVKRLQHLARRVRARQALLGSDGREEVMLPSSKITQPAVQAFEPQEKEALPEPEPLPELPPCENLRQWDLPQPEVVDAPTPAVELAPEAEQDVDAEEASPKEQPSLGSAFGKGIDQDRFDSGGPFA